VRISSWPGCNRSSLARGRIHLSRLSSSDRPRNLQRRGRRYISADYVLKHLTVQRQVRRDLLQLRVLILELFQPPHLRRLHPVILFLPIEIGRRADPSLPEDVGDGNPSAPCRRMNAFCATETRCFHRLPLLRGRGNNAESSNSERPSFRGADQVLRRGARVEQHAIGGAGRRCADDRVLRRDWRHRPAV
jgi:hypothetical protein